MAYVITALCRDCVETACVSVCPVDCIYQYTGGNREAFPNQLYIHPEECISCGACEPECPWQAIYEEQEVPDVLKDGVRLNYSIIEHAPEFRVPEHDRKGEPSPEQVTENKRKWGVAP